MGLPEQRYNQRDIEFDNQKELIGPVFFDVRFGLGPHSIEYTDWAARMSEDMDAFFEPSGTPQRNILFIENELGSKTSLGKLNRAYKHYGSYVIAYSYVELGIDGYFPPALQVRARHTHLVDSQQDEILAEGSRFTGAILEAVDEIAARKNIEIELTTETIRDRTERDTIASITEYLESFGGFTSVEELKRFATTVWKLDKLRERKVVDDLLEFYKQASKRKIRTKTYVSLGGGHVPIINQLTERFGSRSGYSVSASFGKMDPQYERNDIIYDRAYPLLEAPQEAADVEWQEVYQEVIARG